MQITFLSLILVICLLQLRFAISDEVSVVESAPLSFENIDADPDPHKENSVGRKLWDLADEGKADELKGLLEKVNGHDVINWVNWLNYPYTTALARACYKGNVEVVRLLLSQKNIHKSINKRNEDGNSPLALASGKGHVEIVKMLLDQPSIKMSINYVNTYGNTPLKLAAKYGNHLNKKAIEAMLTAKGARDEL